MSTYLDTRFASGGFDLKSFMINEGLTRVSRDRKKLLNENIFKTITISNGKLIDGKELFYKAEYSDEDISTFEQALKDSQVPDGEYVPFAGDGRGNEDEEADYLVVVPGGSTPWFDEVLLKRVHSNKNSKDHPWRKKNDKLFTKKRRIRESVEEDENVVTVRAGHQFEDVWGRGMTPEDIAIFTEDPEDMYLDGDIESWDEIKPGKYYVWSDAVSGEDEPEAYFGKSVDEIPWDYSFAVRSHSNPYDTEGFMLCRLDGDLSESEHQTTGPKSGYVRQGRINKDRPHSNVRTKQTGSKTYGRAKEGGLSDFEWEEHNKTAKTWVVGKDGKGHYVAPKEAGGKYTK